LDFSPGATTAATTAATNANARRNNQDIMSLFGSASPTVSSQPSTTQQAASQPLDAFSSLNLGGGGSGSSFPSYSNNNVTNSGFGSASNGMGRAASNSLSGGNPWAAAPPAASAPAPSLSNNLYSNTSSSSSYSAYSTPANPPTTQNAFTSPAPASTTASLDLFNSADIWGSSNNSKGASSGDGFGGFSGASTTNKNAFDDLWS
jgi:hypothetical protein